MYDVSVHSLAERVFTHIRRQELLSAGDRVGVAVSGGIDSVALLRLLIELRGELGIVLSVVHFNHKLRGAESDADQDFAARLACEFDLEFYCRGDDTARYAEDEARSLETAARELRYRFFHHLLGDGEPQGLKPATLSASDGTSELVPFPNVSPTEVLSSPSVSSTNSLSTICTGHTLDDQAETVLMRLIRGTGLRGLGAIHPRLAVEDESGEVWGEIVRPLLGFRRAELEAYLREIGQKWREDASNADDRFTRNRVRHALLPLIEREFNPSVAENLSELAEIARGEEDYWENEAAGWMGRAVQWAEPEWANQATDRRMKGLVQIGGPCDKVSPCASADSDLESRIDSVPWLVVNGSLNRIWLLGEPIAVQRRVIKAMGEHVRLPLEFKHIDELLQFAAEDCETGKEISLPLGWKMVRHPEELVLVTPDLRQRADSAAGQSDYEYDLPVPGRVLVKEAHATFESQRIPGTQEQPVAGSGQLLDAEALPGPLRVRNWRPGDRFWPAHTKAPKKIKELLQRRTTEPDDRKLWPVILSGDVIVWVRGFPVPAKFQAKPGREAVLILERALGGHLPGTGTKIWT